MTFNELKNRYLKLQRIAYLLRHNEILLMKFKSSEYREKVKYYRRQLDKHLRNDKQFDPDKPEIFYEDKNN